MASYPTGGVPPKPASKRRRRNVPKSYGSLRRRPRQARRLIAGDSSISSARAGSPPRPARWPGRWPSCGSRTRVLISVSPIASAVDPASQEDSPSPHLRDQRVRVEAELAGVLMRGGLASN